MGSAEKVYLTARKDIRIVKFNKEWWYKRAWQRKFHSSTIAWFIKKLNQLQSKYNVFKAFA